MAVLRDKADIIVRERGGPGENREQPTEENTHLPHIGDGKDRPGQRDGQQHIQMSGNRVVFQPPAKPGEFFHRQQHKQHQPPQGEVPSGAVPQAGEQPHHQQVAQGAPAAAPAAPQRNIHIIAEPVAQSHMPPPPEFRHAAGGIGLQEVFRYGEAQHLPKPDGHERVAVEIKVELEGKGGNAHQCQRGAHALIADHGQVAPQTA